MNLIPESLAALKVPVDGLLPYGRNPRLGDVGLIAGSLETNGQYRPIVVNSRTSEVLAGNHTLKAALSLGWREIAATFVDVDEEQAARIALVDIRSNDVAGYDDRVLAELLESLPDLTGTGFDAADLDELLARVAGLPSALTDPDDVPDLPAAPRSQIGDVWLLGPHRLVVGDGTTPDAVAGACGGRVAAAYVTDPPYNVAYVGKTKDALTIDNDDMGDVGFKDLLLALFSAAIEHTKPGGPVYVFHADIECVNVCTALTEAGWLHKQILIWVKNTLVLGQRDHHLKHESILYGWRPGAAHAWYGGRKLTTVLEFDRPTRSDVHPTMKPVDLLTALIERSTRAGELVLDTCAGSGSTLIACHGASRVAALVELDPQYADVICRRYQEHTGTKPVLETTGEPHDFTG